MLSKLDDSVGRVVAALQQKDMLQNSIIVFTTDNGGPAAGFDDNAASNWPLRGVSNTTILSCFGVMALSGERQSVGGRRSRFRLIVVAAPEVALQSGQADDERAGLATYALLRCRLTRFSQR